MPTNNSPRNPKGAKRVKAQNSYLKAAAFEIGRRSDCAIMCTQEAGQTIRQRDLVYLREKQTEFPQSGGASFRGLGKGVHACLRKQRKGTKSASGGQGHA